MYKWVWLEGTIVIIWSNLPAAAVILQHTEQDCVQVMLEYVQGERLHNLFEQLIQSPAQ